VAATCTLGVLSDIHYASPAEQARGEDYEYRDLRNPFLRHFIRLHRRYIWLREPLKQNHLLDRFLGEAGPLDYVVANGDYSCDSIFVGLSDDAAFQSARECLDKLRGRFGSRLMVTLGDHEFGKLSLAGRRGGMRLASWRRATGELGLAPFWRLDLGCYTLVGVVSSLLGLPLFEADMLPEERPEWERLRERHLEEIRQAFAQLEPERRVLLFCHDPTALPFLWQEESVRAKASMIEQTIIGHLHTNLVLREARLLAGMPVIGFLGHAVRRMTSALHEASYWRPFHVRLCPSLAGVELLKDGGFYRVELDLEGRCPARFQFCRMKRP
jgi:hypothetical protein